MTYDNIKRAAAITKWPVKKLKLAKNEIGAPGFEGNRVQWDNFQAWYNVAENKTNLDSLYEATIKPERVDSGSATEPRSEYAIRLSILAKDDILRDLEIKKKSGEYLDPKQVNDFLLKLRLSFESIIKGWAGSLPSKLVGKSQGEIEVEISNQVAVLLSSFKTNMRTEMAKCSKK